MGKRGGKQTLKKSVGRKNCGNFCATFSYKLTGGPIEKKFWFWRPNRKRGYLATFTEKRHHPWLGFDVNVTWTKQKSLREKQNYTNCPCTHQHLFLAFSLRCVTRGWQLKKKARSFWNIQTKKTFYESVSKFLGII